MDQLIETVIQSLGGATEKFEYRAESLMQRAAEKYGLDKVAVFETDTGRGRIKFSRTLFWSGEEVPSGHSSQMELDWNMICKLVPDIMETKYIAVDDCERHPMSRLIPDYGEMQVKSVLYCMLIQDGQVKGCVAYSDCKAARNWKSDEIQKLGIFGGLLGNFLLQYRINQKNRSQLEYLSGYDRLTGSLPLEQFARRASGILEEYPEREFFIVYYSLGNIKSVNADFGFETGDKIIRQFAYYLRAYENENERLGRISGNGFIELREKILDMEEEAKTIKGRMEAFCRLQERRMNLPELNVKTGLCQVEPHTTNLQREIEGAREAWKTVGELHGCVYRIYDEELELRKKRELEIHNSMWSALRNEEFVVYYQPKYNLESGELAGMEALTRWKRNGTMVPPDSFIPLFEKNGFIECLDEYVLRQVLRDIKKWQESGKQVVPVSINLSGWEVKNDLYIDKVLELIKRSRISTEYLEFELTETVCGEDPKRTKALLEKLKQKGISVSIDDFGSGYAALGMLAYIPADTVKIDKGLLKINKKGEREEILLSSIILMLTQMGFCVLCEGIEREEEMEWLKEHGCCLGQGYYYSPAVPADQAFLWLASVE